MGGVYYGAGFAGRSKEQGAKGEQVVLLFVCRRDNPVSIRGPVPAPNPFETRMSLLQPFDPRRRRDIPVSIRGPVPAPNPFETRMSLLQPFDSPS